MVPAPPYAHLRPPPCVRGLKSGAAQGLAGPALLLFGDVFRKRAHTLIGQELMAGDTPLQATPPFR